MGGSFGGRDAAAPLLLGSGRSGAAISMPGMMGTGLNLGPSDAGCERGGAATGNPRFVWDSYRRLIDMYGDVVMGVRHAAFEAELTAAKAAAGARADTDLTAEQLHTLVGRYKAVYRAATGADFPQDPAVQLAAAIAGVFRSWNTPRAVTYRKINHITGLLGTAVNVQAMVYGNTGPDSGSGVLFTRNPSTGARALYGEVLMNCQGEDVVSGVRTPLPIAALESIQPAVYAELEGVVRRLEAAMRDMQDVEFTIQDRRLWILQCRDGKRNGAAALRIALDMLAAGEVDEETAVRKLVTPAHIDQLLHPRFKTEPGAGKLAVLVKGMAASPGAAVGRVVFTAEDAAAWKERGERVILVRRETSAEDVGGMHAAQGILTSHGGMTSHAAVVARGWGKPCVTGAGDLGVDYAAKTASTRGGVVIHEGDWLSVNGTTGEVVAGKLDLVPPEITKELTDFLALVARYSPIDVYANADNRADAEVALRFGARGIGLVRTEHMFWGPQRIRHMRDVILASTLEKREEALAALFPFQKDDFLDIFKAVAVASGAARAGGGAGAGPSSAPSAPAPAPAPFPPPVAGRPPPLHEYLPYGLAQQEELAGDLGVTLAALQTLVATLVEANPMMGCRGVRVSVTKPEIARMQTRAILTAAAEAAAAGFPTAVEIMIPLVGTQAETEHVRGIIDATAAALAAESGTRVEYKVGTMIETPRACVDAGAIARVAEFFNFGTNDLTAMTYGYSRDDAPKWIPKYIDVGILPDDPFQTLDKEGVGSLIRMAIERGRAARPGLPVGVCGEVGGDERSVPFFVAAGVDYVSCSPYRVPVALLAAAQAGMAAKAAAAAAAAAPAT